jgi:sulfite exporter TauE/SafE/copper chaperone CopZ
MSRASNRSTKSTQRHQAPAAPRQAGSAAHDLAFGMSVDRLLALQAASRASGSEPAHALTDLAPQAHETPIRLISTTVPVAGMTCRSCENRITRHVSKIAGVERVEASAVRGRVTIESSAAIPPAAIAKAISAAGYEIGRTPWLTADPDVWITAVAGIALVGALVVLASLTGLANLASGAGDLSRGGIVVALLLGLAAGVSTCAALVGGLVLALSASFEAHRAATGADGASVIAKMRPAVVFIAGRIVGYALFGAALGALGASVILPPQVTALLMIVVAIVMTILGTRLTGLSPRIASWSPTLPMGLGRRLGLAEGTVGGYSDGRAALLGAASFFLPCGFTQAVQVYALSTGSPVVAGTILAVFAIGTAPGLLALAGLPVVVPIGWRPHLMRLVGVIVLAFAFVNASAGIRLSGISLPFGVQPVAAAGPVATTTSADGTQTLTTYQDYDGYSPGNVSIYSGTPTRWIIQSKTTATCAASLVVPSLGLQVRLRQGANTVNLPALPAGRLAYSCAMGMFGGSITIVDRPTGGSGTGG